MRSTIFLLQHEVLIDDLGRAAQQVEQERRRDVVRQIADDAQPLAARLRQCTEIDLQDIGLDHLDPGRSRSRCAQIAVEFDDG